MRLLPGIERTIEGAHVLLINFPAAATLAVRRLDDLAALKAAHPPGLMVAPHPFYPIRSALGRRRLDAHAALWDAIEVTRCTSAPSIGIARHRLGRRARRPLVGNGDVHRLMQLGRTWSEVDVDVPERCPIPTRRTLSAPPFAPDASAWRGRRCRVRAAIILAQMELGGLRGRLGI